jgi:hypothetical protein
MFIRTARYIPRFRGVRLNSTLGKPKPTEAQKEANIKNGERYASELTEAKMLGVGVAAMAGGYYLYNRKTPQK